MIRSNPLTAAALLLCTVFSVLSCDRKLEREPSRGNQPLAIQFRDWIPEEGARILAVVDSLERVGDITELRADFNRGIAYDMMKRNQVAEMYYRRA